MMVRHLDRAFAALVRSPIFVVNVLKGKLWDAKSEFDEAKDKSQFRDYDSACDRVKAFYKEQHGLPSATPLDVHELTVYRHQKNRLSSSTSRLEWTSKAKSAPA